LNFAHKTSLNDLPPPNVFPLKLCVFVSWWFRNNLGSQGAAYAQFFLSKGPHGLTFLHHARKGGEAAVPVLHYLESLGAS
jgi:hypothetical protein